MKKKKQIKKKDFSEIMFLLEQERLRAKKDEKAPKKARKKELEEIVEAVKKAKKDGKIGVEYGSKFKADVKTNYNTPAEIYGEAKTKYNGEVKTKAKKSGYLKEELRSDIKTDNFEKLGYDDIERITKQEITNSILGGDKWNNISPQEMEDYENWKNLSPGAKILWWSLVQHSGYGVRDIVY